MVKTKVKENTELLTHDQAFNIGWTSEQDMADFICSKIPDTDEDARAVAFIASFQALTSRMLNVFEKDFLLDIVNEVDGVEQKENVSDDQNNSLH